jgi:hypothetical protein
VPLVWPWEPNRGASAMQEGWQAEGTLAINCEDFTLTKAAGPESAEWLQPPTYPGRS